MNRLVEDLLVLARAEQAGFVSLAAVDLGELTAEVHRKSSVLCAQQWTLDETAHVVTVADGQLSQAMLQLAANACQHTRDDTRCTSARGWSMVRSACGCTTAARGYPPKTSSGSLSASSRAAEPRGQRSGAVDRVRHRRGPRRARSGRTCNDGARFEILIPLVTPPATATHGRERAEAAAS